jgi:hypothetical protein
MLKKSAMNMINMNFLLSLAMRMLHGGIEEGADCAVAANASCLP